MNEFVKAVNTQLNRKVTENGQAAYASTDFSKLLDFFAVAGALRTRDERDITTKMAEAFAEDSFLATKLLFFLSDIREGLGERRTFRVALEWLAKRFPEVVEMNLANIPHFNRWDSLFVLRGTPCEKAMVAFVKKQLRQDTQDARMDKPISLLAKWMPSINTSSAETCELARWFAAQMHLTTREYRHILAYLRDKLRVVEVIMSNQSWDEVKYDVVPSRAMLIYRRAFGRHDGERFGEFLTDVKSGKKTIKAGTLFPYDIVEKLMHGEENDVLEEQWKALPNYIEGDNNILVMADVSGSMSGRPIATSVGLALYFAERNQGAYHNLFMTFSRDPQFVKVHGNSLADKIHNAAQADWGMNTNLNRAFDKILSVAVENHVPVDQLPKALIVISDMEIDAAQCGNWDFLTLQKNKFARYGYALPNIIFWNVQSRQDTFLVDGNRPGVQLASGQSASTFKHILNGIDMTPFTAMIECLTSERYERVVVPDGWDNAFATKMKNTGSSLAENRAIRKATIDRLFQ